MFTLDKVKLYTFNPCIHLTLVILPMQFTYVSKMQEKVMFINESGW